MGISAYGHVRDWKRGSQRSHVGHGGYGCIIFASGTAARRASVSAFEKAAQAAQPRKQKGVRAELILELRKTRNSARISQLLEKISPRTNREYSMGITAYGRVRDWKRALSLLDRMREQLERERNDCVLQTDMIEGDLKRLSQDERGMCATARFLKLLETTAEPKVARNYGANTCG